MLFHDALDLHKRAPVAGYSDRVVSCVTQRRCTAAKSVCSCTGKLVREWKAQSATNTPWYSSCPMPLIDFTGRKRASALRLIGN